MLYWFSVFVALPVVAFRPEGKKYGEQQLDVDLLEKDLGKKFSIPFPDKSYDIDYFDKGDLASFVVAGEKVMVTCPVMSDSEIHLAFGSGSDAKNYKMTADLFVAFAKDGKLWSFYVFPNGPGDKYPTHEDRPHIKEGESAQTYFERAKKHWFQWIKEKKSSVTKAQLEAAFQVVDATLKQERFAKGFPPAKDPTVEEDFR